MRQKSWQSLDTTTTKRTENVSYKIFTFQSWYPSLLSNPKQMCAYRQRDPHLPAAVDAQEYSRDTAKQIDPITVARLAITPHRCSLLSAQTTICNF